MASKDKEGQSSRWHHNLQSLCISIVLYTLLLPVQATPLSLDTTPLSTMKVSDHEFSQKLSNPCSVINPNRTPDWDTMSQEDKEIAKRNMIAQMKSKTQLLKENSETILHTHVLETCSTLVLPAVANIPSAENIADSAPLDVLRLFYTSLLNHTAHVFYIPEQQERYSQGDSTCNVDPELSTEASKLAFDMQKLMCVIRVGTYALQEVSGTDDTFEQSTDQILNEELSDQPLCSRRRVRDCQTIFSTVTLMRELCDYLKSVFDDTYTTI